jgi:hypothetical protein
MGKCA